MNGMDLGVIVGLVAFIFLALAFVDLAMRRRRRP